MSRHVSFLKLGSFVILFLLLQGYSISQSRMFKGSTHVHTNLSDGQLSPEAVAENYYKQHYDFIFFTDHNRVTGLDPSPFADFLCIPGEEVTYRQHLSALNLSYFVFPGPTPWVLDNIHYQNALAVLNHPIWPRTLTFAPDILDLNDLHFIEIFNGQTESWGHIDDQSLWDEVLSHRKLVYGIASDDSHLQSEIGKGFIMVASDTLMADSITSSIRQGRFYSSTGVYITELILIDSVITIRSPNATKILFRGENRQIFKKVSGNSATYKIEGNESYVRIELADNQSHRAWTQPLVWMNTFSNKIIFSNDSVPCNIPGKILLSVYPNPAGDFLFVETSLTGLAKIYDPMGKVILSQRVLDFRNEINVSSLKKGSYLLEFVSADGWTKSVQFFKK